MEEDLYCNTCKDYTKHVHQGLVTVCGVCQEIYDYDKKRFIICGPADDVAVLESRKTLLDKDPSVIIIDEEIALKHKLKGLPMNPKDIAMELKAYPIMNHLKDMEYNHLTKKEREAVVVPVRTEPKIRRNDPCPCGSGKKYKNCCLKNRGNGNEKI
jgi:hypothetical protein